MKYRFLLKPFLILRKKNISLNKGKPSEKPFNIAQNQEFELVTSHQFKNRIFAKPTWSSQQSLIPSRNLQRQHYCSSYFAHISDHFIKKRLLRKSSNTGHGNHVLITSTVQVELSKLNFNFDEIRTNIFKFLRFFKIIVL